MNYLRRGFSKLSQDSAAKTFNPISRLQHVKLDLNTLLGDNMLPLLRQNIKNRKATYADADRCHQL